MDKQNVAYSFVQGYSPALKRKDILTWATAWVKVEDVILREISQEQKDKYCMIPLVAGT